MALFLIWYAISITNYISITQLLFMNARKAIQSWYSFYLTIDETCTFTYYMYMKVVATYLHTTYLLKKINATLVPI